MNDTADTESVLREGLKRWKAAVDAHQPQQVAAVFTEDAIFQLPERKPRSVPRFPGRSGRLQKGQCDGS